MLSKKLFRNGLEELQNAFSRFELDENKIKIWYKYSKYLTDSQWKEKIEKCIRFCRKIPTLADVLDLSGYYKNEEDWSKVKIFKEDNYEWKPIPPKDKEQIHKVLNIPDRDKLKEDK